MQITTREIADERLHTVIYPVADVIRTDAIPSPARLSDPYQDLERAMQERIEAKLQQRVAVAGIWSHQSSEIGFRGKRSVCDSQAPPAKRLRRRPDSPAVRTATPGHGTGSAARHSAHWANRPAQKSEERRPDQRQPSVGGSKWPRGGSVAAVESRSAIPSAGGT